MAKRRNSQTQAGDDARMAALRARRIAAIADDEARRRREEAAQRRAALPIPALPIAARMVTGYRPRAARSTRRERTEEMHPAFAACLTNWNVPDAELTAAELAERRRAGRK